ncbi:MAG: DUF58 domain-containing protein [Chitinophagales bacterium]|nr:DUF58 domain-containing protein [Chitinophagales bacterium]
MNIDIDYKQFDKLDLLARQVVEGFIIGLHKSPYHGFSVEFSEFRNYYPGDSMRNIDWKAYAKTGKMYIKKFEEETNLRCQILIDISSSMLYPKTTNQQSLNKLEFSTVSAATLTYLLGKQRDAVGLTLMSGHQLKIHTPTKTNAAHRQVIMNYLHQALKSQEDLVSTHLATCLHQVAEMLHKRSMVFVFSDWIEKIDDIDDLIDAIRHLKYNKHEVVIFHVYRKKEEQELMFENRSYQFVDFGNWSESQAIAIDKKKLQTKI